MTAEVCFANGGRVRVAAIPHDRPAPPQAPAIACTGCHAPVAAGAGFFVEIDSGQGWGIGTEVICGPCMAAALRPSAVLAAYRA